MLFAKNVSSLCYSLLKAQRDVCSLHRQLHNSAALWAGHSKWANIKHVKAQKDGQKAMLFMRIARQIRLAIQEGGSADPALNSQLRSVVEDAVRKSMPMATIQSNIKRSQQAPAQLKRYVMELRYKQKVFAVCVIYTDNYAALKMSAAPILKKGGAIQTDVIHLFDDFGLIEAKYDEATLKDVADFEERVTDDAIECGAEEVDIIDAPTGFVNFTCSPTALNAVRYALEKKGYKIESTEHIYLAKNTIQLTEDEQKSYQSFVQKLRELPGLEDVYDNIEAE